MSPHLNPLARVSRALAVAALVVCARPAGAQNAASDTLVATANKLLPMLAGRWSCDGGFPNGRTLSATMVFASAASGHALTLEHLDRAPGTYWQQVTWAMDGRTGYFLASGMSGSTASSKVTPVSLVAKTWGSGSLAFETDSAKPPVNRYVYSLLPDGALKYAWFLGANGRWVLGDSLVCRH